MRRTILAVTLLSMVMVGSASAQSGNFAFSYDYATLNDDVGNLDGATLDADVNVWDVLYVAGTTSWTSGTNGSLNVSRSFVGVGPRVRIDLHNRVQLFGHVLFGSLNTSIGMWDKNSYDERYGAGIDVGFGDRWLVRVAGDYDGATHLMVGAGLRF